jgi:peptidoglycan hydrolase-like protein with peptidoglycan-binding domain
MQPRRLVLAAGAALALSAPAFAADDAQRNRSAQDSTTQGAGSMSAPMHSASVREAQQALQDKGHDVGPIDGLMGPKTAAAVREFQQAQGLKATGRLDRETLSALNVQSTGMSDARSGMSRARGTGSSSGPTVSSDAKSPSPSSTETGKSSPSASGTSPKTTSSPPSAAGSSGATTSGAASPDTTSPSPSSTQSGKAGG